MYANVSDQDCPRGIGQNHLFVKQETLGLQNALVIVDRHDRRVMPTMLQVQLATVGCQLLPRIQWVTLGTSLSLLDKDGAHHHLQAYVKDNLMFEAELAAGAAPLRRPLVVPGFYQIDCDRHPWERAWVYVSPHDSVAVTDAEGRFTIKNVPVGRYRIMVWHEGWEEKGGLRQDRPEFTPMQDVREIKVRENQETRVLFDTLKPAP
jgi:hypothetical protein